MKILHVGDVHAVSSELAECEKLMELIDRTPADGVCFLGDQYNNHDAVSVRVMNFWDHWFKKIAEKKQVFAVVGNHDQSGSGLEELHALRAHSSYVTVIDKLTHLWDGTWAIPYYHDEEKLKEAIGGCDEWAHTLICHATFDGAQFDNGFYDPDAFSLDAIKKFKTVISGHIHTPQAFANVTYIGAPRWRTLSDANIDRHLVLYDHDVEKTVEVEKYPTSEVCRKIVCFDDLPNEPVEIPEGNLDVRVDIYGSLEHVRKREQELRAQGVRTRSFPDRPKRVEVKESDGVPAAFGGYVKDFKPPHGTDKKTLKKELEKRL